MRRNLYDRVPTRDAKMQVFRELAASFKQIDATTCELRLHRGIRFHNGEEMTADDVRFTFDRLTRDGTIGGLCLAKPQSLRRRSDRSHVPRFCRIPGPENSRAT